MSATRLDAAAFKRLARISKRPGATVTQTRDASPTPSGSRRISFIFSDESVDRDGDVVRQAGWKLDNFKKNPVIIFGHDPSRVENIIGRAENVRVAGKQLLGDVIFADASVNPTAETVYQLYKHKFLNAVSVGFAPLDFKFSDDKDRDGGVDFLSMELCEVSCVPIPANANALAVARSKGFDVSRVLPLLKSAPAASKQPNALLKRVRAMPKSVPQAMQRGMTNAEIRALLTEGWLTLPENPTIAFHSGWSSEDYHEARRRGLML